MLKIRLEGFSEEVKAASEELKEIFNVVQISKEYKNRGQSAFVRVYISAERKES